MLNVYENITAGGIKRGKKVLETARRNPVPDYTALHETKDLGVVETTWA
ncbi:MAG: hypothetical protein LBJ59_10070 [Zoogloeaceae bacterium]|jgi:hypothetical protein|nr:hypothetical protein [Zoogloeaceae bacterium]